MADKTPKYGSAPLDDDDEVFYKEILNGVYSEAVAAVVMLDTDKVSATNPLPVTTITSDTQARDMRHVPIGVFPVSTPVIAANPNRKYLLLENDSNTDIYINLGNNAALNGGIRLNSSGGKYEMSAQIGNLYTGLVRAIHGSTGQKVLLVTEGV